MTVPFFAFHTPPRGINNETTCTLNNTTLEQAMNDELFQKYCIGFIDVNGVKRPNKETRCNDNKAHYTDINSECFVDEVTDIFPVIYYDAVVAPAQPQPEQYYISNLAYFTSQTVPSLPSFKTIFTSSSATLILSATSQFFLHRGLLFSERN